MALHPSPSPSSWALVPDHITDSYPDEFNEEDVLWPHDKKSPPSSIISAKDPWELAIGTGGEVQVNVNVRPRKINSLYFDGDDMVSGNNCYYGWRSSLLRVDPHWSTVIAKSKGKSKESYHVDDDEEDNGRAEEDDEDGDEDEDEDEDGDGDGDEDEDEDEDDDDDDDDDGSGNERLPPHELLARENSRSQRITFSVCEGIGRTLKGRDLSRVRNAVWSHLGFAD